MVEQVGISQAELNQMLGGNSSSPMIERYASVIKEMTDPSYLIPIIESSLRREKVIKVGDEWKSIKGGDPLLNDLGINNILSIISIVINNNPVLNNLNIEMIQNLIRQIYHSVIKDLMVSRKRYGIQSSKDRDLIVNIVTIPVYITLLRGLEGGERKFLGLRPGYAEAGGSRGTWNPFSRGK